MDGMGILGEEEFKECLAIHGYRSEKESDSDFEETKSECDELYEKYKPPPRLIDPKKSKIIILNDKGGSELSLNGNNSNNGKKKRKRKRTKKKKSKKSSATMDAASDDNKLDCDPNNPHCFQTEIVPSVCDTSKNDIWELENTIFSNCCYYFLPQHINYSWYLNENIKFLNEIQNTKSETMDILNHLQKDGTVQDECNQCFHTLEYSKNYGLNALQSHPLIAHESPKNSSHTQLDNELIENMISGRKCLCDVIYSRTNKFIQISKYLKTHEYGELSNDAHSLHRWSENLRQGAIIEDMTSHRKDFYFYDRDQNKTNQISEFSKYCEFSALSDSCSSFMSSGLHQNFSHIQLSNAPTENMTIDKIYFSDTSHNQINQLNKITEKSKNCALSNDVNPLISSGSVESSSHIEITNATIEDMTSERKYFYGSYSSASWYNFQSAYLNEDTSNLITNKNLTKKMESLENLNQTELSKAIIEDMTSERKYFYGNYSSASWYDFQSAFLNKDTSSLISKKKDNKEWSSHKTPTTKLQIHGATESNNFYIGCQELVTNDWRAINLIAGYLFLRLALPWILTCLIYIFDKTIDVIVLIFLLLYLSVIFVTKY